jgi:hypothetical protein
MDDRDHHILGGQQVIESSFVVVAFGFVEQSRIEVINRRVGPDMHIRARAE